MISKNKFLEKVQEIAASKPTYKLGHDGSDGTCDCIGLIIGAIRRAGQQLCGGNMGGSNSVTLTGAHLPNSPITPYRTTDRFVTMCLNTDSPDGYITPAASGTLPLYWSGNWGTRALGDGDSHENRPPYFAVYMWRRTS